MVARHTAPLRCRCAHAATSGEACLVRSSRLVQPTSTLGLAPTNASSVNCPTPRAGPTRWNAATPGAVTQSMAVAALPVSPASLPLDGRISAPELLDTLAPDSPEARASRRELHRINVLAGNERWFARTLHSRCRPPSRALEIGAGDGALARRLAPLLRVDGLDRIPRPAHFPALHRWHEVDALAFRDWQDYPIVLGNLVWHHFTDGELRRLGAALSPHAELVLASEPHRSAWARWLFRATARALRLSLVTRHDGAVSIAAGFRGDELPRLLGLDRRQWHCRVTLTARGAYRLVAEKLR